MNPAEGQEDEFIIPTRYKVGISSRLSWPLGAKELTKNLADVPQLNELQLSFTTGYKFNQQGKWPAVSIVFNIQYSPQSFTEKDSRWQITVFPVPRNLRAKVREALAIHGFKSMADWLGENAKFSGQESSRSFSGFWHSEGNELSYSTHDYVVPEISTNKPRKQE